MNRIAELYHAVGSKVDCKIEADEARVKKLGAEIERRSRVKK